MQNQYCLCEVLIIYNQRIIYPDSHTNSHIRRFTQILHHNWVCITNRLIRMDFVPYILQNCFLPRLIFTFSFTQSVTLRSRDILLEDDHFSQGLLVLRRIQQLQSVIQTRSFQGRPVCNYMYIDILRKCCILCPFQM